jgi:hypothetical protein
MSAPLYFNGIDAEECHPAWWHLADMIAKGEAERTLFKAVQVPTSIVFWCREFDAVCGVGPEHKPCGRSCDGYEPRNGKNGRCKSHAHCYEPDEKQTIVLKAKA